MCFLAGMPEPFKKRGNSMIPSPKVFLPCPEKLTLACYRIRLLAGPRGLSLPAYKGSTLRGGFASTFQRLVCGTGKRQCRDCPLKQGCPYALVFESEPPPGSEALRNYESIPRPFLLEPPLETRTEYPPGELLVFHLVLLGRALNLLPYFIVTLDELGRCGIGRERRPFHVDLIEAFHPLNGEKVAIFSGADRVVRPQDLSLTARELWDKEWGSEGPAASGGSSTLPAPDEQEVRLDFLTPTRLTFEGKPVTVPEFHIIVRHLLRRLSSLCYFHHGFDYRADFPAIIARAQEVRLVAHGTRWEEWERYSSRQTRRVPCGGLVGWAVYRGNWREFAPLLRLGELLHVGKGTVFGQGQYRLVPARVGVS